MDAPGLGLVPKGSLDYEGEEEIGADRKEQHSNENDWLT